MLCAQSPFLPSPNRVEPDSSHGVHLSRQLEAVREGLADRAFLVDCHAGLQVLARAAGVSDEEAAISACLGRSAWPPCNFLIGQFRIWRSKTKDAARQRQFEWHELLRLNEHLCTTAQLWLCSSIPADSQSLGSAWFHRKIILLRPDAWPWSPLFFLLLFPSSIPILASVSPIIRERPSPLPFSSRSQSHFACSLPAWLARLARFIRAEHKRYQKVCSRITQTSGSPDPRFRLFEVLTVDMVYAEEKVR